MTSRKAYETKIPRTPRVYTRPLILILEIKVLMGGIIETSALVVKSTVLKGIFDSQNAKILKFYWLLGFVLQIVKNYWRADF